MLGPFRYRAHIKHMNHASLAFNSKCLGQVISRLAAGRFNYSQEKGGGCCKDVAQSSGKKVEPWPKSDPPPQPWRAECSQEPQPPNYDPYRIKVPDVVVPPLPPSNVKRTGVVYTIDQHDQNEEHGIHHHRQSGFQTGVDSQVVEDEETENPGFLGRLKGFFGRLGRKDSSKEDDGQVNAMMKDCCDINWLVPLSHRR
uniref:Uncharacterized protein n=1 Tax=Heliothis virescens TaxID=7102 RepID=A0A2A4J0H9_HELVI